MKYHFVLFSYPRDYFKVMFQEAIDKLDIEYITDPIVYGGYGKFIEFIYHLHINDYLNWAFRLPFQNLWYKYFYRNKTEKPICFVFLMDWCQHSKRGIVDSLKYKYPHAKFVLYLEDLVASHPFDIEEVKKFDLVITYDKGDAEKFGYEYLPTFLSKIDVFDSEVPKSNCSFIGLPKNRVELINKIYKKLSNNGLICDFIVSGAKDETKRISGINYIKRDIPYYEYLKHVNSTDCIVEIMQNNATGYTLRTWEALLYGKRLLTNNKAILDAPFYNPNQFVVFDKVEDVDIQKLKTVSSFPHFEKSSISPLNLFRLINEKL